MFTKHNYKTRSNQFKPRCNNTSVEGVPNVRCNHPPLAGGSKLQGNFGEGALSITKNSYSQKKLQFAKNLRHNQTDAEGLLWYYIRSKQLGGFKFKRQQIIGKYIVDFVCFKKELIIELDGSQHGEIDIIKSDKIRDDFLKYRGFKILRFWNGEIYKNCFEVLDFIYFQLKR